MLDSFSVALWAVIPMAMLLGVGALLRTAKIIDRPTMRAVDEMTFRVFMPTLLFKNIYDTNLAGGLTDGEVAFALMGLLVVFLFALWAPRRLVADHNKAASIGQAIVRSNYILFGVAVAESIYGEGNAGPVALLGAIVVPATNALAVVILELNRSGSVKPGKLLLSILKNPMMVAALAALSLVWLRVTIPALLYKVIADISAVTTTISFLSLGVSLDLGEMAVNRRPLTIGVIMRMVLVPTAVLPAAVAFGFRGPILCALMVLFAAPAAVSSYPMAVAMDADGQLAGQLVCFTTLVSILTMFCFTFLFKSLGLL